jgi:hypothetical protein
MWVMGVGGISLMSIDSLRRRAVADRGLACWHILLGFVVLRAGRVAIVALCTAGRSAFTIDAMIICQIEKQRKRRIGSVYV